MSNILESIKIFQSGSGSIFTTIGRASGGSSYSVTIPNAQGSNGTVLTNNGGGTLSWATPAGAITSDADDNTVGGTDAGASLVASSGLSNTCFGKDAGTAISSGDENVCVGAGAGDSIAQGSNNVCIGSLAGAGITTGTDNICIGSDAGLLLSAESNNICIGTAAGSALTTSDVGDVMIGYNAGINSTGTDTIFIGEEAGKSMTSGNRNIAIGAQAMGLNSGGCTGNDNVSMGYIALGKANSTANQNTALGSWSMGNSNLSGSRNSGLGYQSGYKITTGNDNMFVGYNAGFTCTTGSQNVCVGRSADVDNLANTNSVAVGYSAVAAAGAIALGASVNNTTDNSFQTITGLPSADSTVLHYNNTTGQITQATSSKRFKENIQNLEIKSENIYNLRPVSYNYKKSNHRTIGYIAEEMSDCIPEVVQYDDVGPYSINYGYLTIPIIEEMKRLRARITALESQI